VVASFISAAGGLGIAGYAAPWCSLGMVIAGGGEGADRARAAGRVPAGLRFPILTCIYLNDAIHPVTARPVSLKLQP